MVKRQSKPPRQKLREPEGESFFLCECGEQFPYGAKTKAFAFGQHLHTNGHRENGVVDTKGHLIYAPRKPLNGEADEGAQEEDGESLERVGTKGRPRTTGSSPLKGRISPIIVDLDPRLFLLHDVVKERFPTYDKSFGGFIYDTVFAYFMEHSQELGIGILFEGNGQQEVGFGR